MTIFRITLSLLILGGMVSINGMDDNRPITIEQRNQLQSTLIENFKDMRTPEGAADIIIMWYDEVYKNDPNFSVSFIFILPESIKKSDVIRIINNLRSDIIENGMVLYALDNAKYIPSEIDTLRTIIPRKKYILDDLELRNKWFTKIAYPGSIQQFYHHDPECPCLRVLHTLTLLDSQRQERS